MERESKDSMCYIITMISITTVHIQMHNKNTIQAKTGGLCCSDTNVFINFWFRFFDMRRDTILKSLYYLTPFQRILWCLRSLSIEIRKTQLHFSTVENSTLCLNGRNQTFCLQGPILTDSKSSNSQDHLFRAWRHPHSSPISCLGVYYDNGDCHILCAWV